MTKKKTKMWTITRHADEYWWGEHWRTHTRQKQTFKRLKDARAWLEKSVLTDESKKLCELASQSDANAKVFSECWHEEYDNETHRLATWVIEYSEIGA